MPLSAMLFLCVLCILTGIVLVLKGISTRSTRRSRTEASPWEHSLEREESTPEQDSPLPFHFLGENRFARRARVKSSGLLSLEECEQEEMGPTADGIPTQERPGRLAFLTAPFRRFARRGRAGGAAMVLDEPVSSGIVLNPRVPAKPHKPASDAGTPGDAD